MERSSRPAVMTIAGSDSGGGAGIQADLLTFAALGVFGTSAITCLTAQNPRGVTGIVPMTPEFVVQQIATVAEALPIAAAKTGMLYSTPIIRAVARAVVEQGIPVLVVDPVMVSAAGARLLEPEAIEALCAELIPQARLITPNLDEARILCGHAIDSVEAMREAAAEIGNQYDVACVIKGGHLPGDEIVDVLYDEGEETLWSGPRLTQAETHGAGCAFSAAITAGLAQGLLLKDAIGRAREFVRTAMQRSFRVGAHFPLNFVYMLPEA